MSKCEWAGMHVVRDMKYNAIQMHSNAANNSKQRAKNKTKHATQVQLNVALH
jgi:hypothetical protein